MTKAMVTSFADPEAEKSNQVNVIPDGLNLPTCAS